MFHSEPLFEVFRVLFSQAGAARPGDERAAVCARGRIGGGNA